MGTLRKLGQMFGKLLGITTKETDKIANQEKQSIRQLITAAAENNDGMGRKYHAPLTKGAYVGQVGYYYTFKHGKRIKLFDSRPCLYTPGKAPVILPAICSKMYKSKLGKSSF